MEFVGLEGNVSNFYYTYPDTLPPGATLSFYVVGFDASANSITIKDADGNNFEISISARGIEEALVYILLIGVPVAVVLVVFWFSKSGKKRKIVPDIP
jgi:hypothetical protein